jgi:DNA (cytosine-5)-methyltransferase 1
VLTVLDLFSGIGGFSLGLERTGGFKTVAFCEIEPFPRRVLAKHWPEVPIYEDVRTLTAARLAADGIGPINVITGGFPCQDISVAGKRAGIAEGTRSGLWSEIVRLAGELRPDFIIVENVANLLRGPSERPGGWFGRVLGDLAECGYDAEWRCIYGYDVGIPQARPRVWIVAYPARTCAEGVLDQNTLDALGFAPWIHDTRGRNANANNKNRGAGTVSILGDTNWPTLFDRRRSGSDGRLSLRMDRYKTIGNTVIPQIPQLIGRAILEAVG